MEGAGAAIQIVKGSAAVGVELFYVDMTVPAIWVSCYIYLL
jgi:hypothetical protein